MKVLILLFIYIIGLYANDALHVEDSKRYFGGMSEAKAELPKSLTYSAPVIVTEEVFSAKDDTQYDEAIQEQKQEQLNSGKVAKEFLQNDKGHLFGGFSQGELSFSK